MEIFESKRKLKAWLADKPSEIGNIIATRSALRILPLIRSDKIARDNLYRNLLILHTFRNNLKSASSIFYPSSYIEKIKNAYEGNDDYHLFLKSKVFEISALSALASNYRYGNAGLILNTVTESITLNPAVASEVSQDIANYFNSLNFLELLEFPLVDLNNDSDTSSQDWLGLKEYLTEYPEENWHVWTDWWEDRRDGKPYNIEMEREIVLIPDEDWQQGPAHVNAMIADIRARYAAMDTPRDIPAENPVAPRFETAENRIVLRADMPDTAPDDEQTALYDALREQAVELRGLCPENSNRYAAQGKAVARFLTALGDDYESMHLSLLWIAGQKMRRFARADDARRTAADPEDDPMEPDQGALFGEVVTTYNVFSTGEPGLKAKDERAVDVATLSPDITAEAREFRRAVAHSPASFGEEVEPLLGEVLEEADDPIPGVEARGVVITRETFENLLGALARKARTEPTPEPSEISKGAKAAIGAGAVGSSAVVASAFIAAFETTLIAFATKLPTSPVWIGIIKSIAAKWDKFI